MFGISEFSAVINPPQACILAIGGGIKRIAPPNIEGGKPRVITVLTVKLSADRRVVDESIAALYLQVFREYVSNPMAISL
jgi:pyruvate dehydrogenase E2 component (dihydrolipoamide acetyltransferase)